MPASATRIGPHEVDAAANTLRHQGGLLYRTPEGAPVYGGLRGTRVRLV